MFERSDIVKEQYMRAALEQAKKAYRNNDVPVGAVVVKNNKIIAEAYNMRETTKDVTDHAEMIAIRKACKYLNDWRLNDCDIYVTLEPCQMCMGAIKQARINKVIYGAPNIKDEDINGVDLEGNVLGDECAELLKLFFQGKRSV